MVEIGAHGISRIVVATVDPLLLLVKEPIIRLYPTVDRRSCREFVEKCFVWFLHVPKKCNVFCKYDKIIVLVN